MAMGAARGRNAVKWALSTDMCIIAANREESNRINSGLMGLSRLIRFKGRSSLYSVEFNHYNAGDGQAANGGGNFDS